MNYVATNAQYVTSWRYIKATFTSTQQVVEDIAVLEEMENENALKINQERSDFQDANNHSTKLQQVMCISVARSRLLPI